MPAQALLRDYLETKRGEILHAVHVAPAGATTTIITAPAAGQRIVVIGGHVSSNTTGTAQWFHTSAAAGNALSGVMSMAGGIDFAVGPWVLPEATLLACQAVTGNVRGWVAYFLGET